ncbi:MAG: hypothetical protein Hens3KO_04800 [Henriciella sp.]
MSTLSALLTSWPGPLLAPLILLPLITLALPKQVGALAAIFSKGIDHISGAALRVAMVFAFAIIVIQLAAVLLRYVFGLSFSWLNDSVIFSFASIFMLGAAATLRDDGHVRVDILRPRFSPAGRAIIELLGALIFVFPICWLILNADLSGLLRSWRILEPFNESDGLPVRYLFKSLVSGFALLLLLQALSQALKAALSLRGIRPYEDSAHDHGGAV